MTCINPYTRLVRKVTDCELRVKIAFARLFCDVSIHIGEQPPEASDQEVRDAIASAEESA